MKREFLQSLKVNDLELPKEVIDAIMAENGRDIQAARSSAQEWEEKYNRAVQAHQQQLADMEFDACLRDAVSAAKGRSVKAIAALLDLDSLKASENQSQAIEQALSALKVDSSYLFEDITPPPYARGTGTQSGAKSTYPATLAGALKEKFERK